MQGLSGVDISTSGNSQRGTMRSQHMVGEKFVFTRDIDASLFSPEKLAFTCSIFYEVERNQPERVMQYISRQKGVD